MVQIYSHMCLEYHKHKGTTFQGTQMSTCMALRQLALIDSFFRMAAFSPFVAYLLNCSTISLSCFIYAFLKP